ncbi:MAG: hypothetical protein R3B06_27635 [Kofleriaceae bacterium]
MGRRRQGRGAASAAVVAASTPAPRRHVWLKRLGLGALIVGVPVGGMVWRCHALRSGPGHAESARIEGDVVVVEDTLCTGDPNAGPLDCELRTIRVDLATGARRSTSLDARRLPTPHGETCRGRDSVTLAGRPLALAGSPPRLGPRGGGVAESPTGATPATFTHPSVVGVAAGLAIVLDDGPATTRLVGVDRDGVARWAVAAPGRCQLARWLDDTVVLATTAGSHRVLRIDAATGQVRWRFAP